jgi:hypothetical protein
MTEEYKRFNDEEGIGLCEETILPKPCTTKQRTASALSIAAGGMAAAAHLVKNFGGNAFTIAFSLSSLLCSNLSIGAGSRVYQYKDGSGLAPNSEFYDAEEKHSWSKTAVKVVLSGAAATLWATSRTLDGASTEERLTEAALASAALATLQEVITPAIRSVVNYCKTPK